MFGRRLRSPPGRTRRLFSDLPHRAIAAGSVLAMLAETMIPEAFERAQNFIGLITVAGFLTFFLLTKIG